MARKHTVPTEINLSLEGLQRVLQTMSDTSYLTLHENDVDGVMKDILRGGSAEHWFTNGAGEVKIFVSAYGSVVGRVTLSNFRRSLNPSITVLFAAAEGKFL